MDIKFKFNVAGNKRKDLAIAIAQIIGATSEYQGMPTASYKIGDYILDKSGVLTGEYNLDLMIALEEQGFETLLEDSFEFEQESLECEYLCIEYPLEGFTPESRINLEKLIESKAVLIKQALGVAELLIIENDSTLKFPWFSADSNSDEVNAYTQFICAICDTAKKKKRVVAKPQQDFENPRFTMRVWLIGLGLIGKEYTLCRKLMMKGLSGDSGWRYGKPEKQESEVGDNA